MSFLFDENPKETKVARFIEAVLHELRSAFADEAKEHGLTQSRLAEKLEVDRAVISRRLNGEGNLTLRTIAELAWAMSDREPVLKLVKAEPDRTANYFISPGATVLTPASTVSVVTAEVA